jgi:hypothetical protein
MSTIKLSKTQWEDAGKKMGWLKMAQTYTVNDTLQEDTKEEKIGGEKYQAELMKHSIRVANDLCKNINTTVPASVEGMRYARQWVLEEAIKILEARV